MSDDQRNLSALPLSCADVTFDMGDGSYEDDLGWWEGGGIGSLIWNPKGGDGHVLTETRTCGEPLGSGERVTTSVRALRAVEQDGEVLVIG